MILPAIISSVFEVCATVTKNLIFLDKNNKFYIEISLFLYLLKPFIFATYTFIIAIISFTSSSYNINDKINYYKFLRLFLEIKIYIKIYNYSIIL